MGLKEQILEKAKARRAKIGIGLIDPSPEIVDSLKRASEICDVVVIGSKVEGFDHVEATEDNLAEKQMEALKSGKVEGMVKGHGDAYKFMDEVARMGNYDRSKIPGVAMFQDAHGRGFIWTSLSHGEGWTKAHKILSVDGAINILKDFGLDPKIGFLTWVRPGSVGRNFFYDLTYEQAEDLVEHYKGKGIDAKNYNIEIETALAEGCNIVVPVNGAAGNMMFRTMTFLADLPLFADQIVGIKEIIVENSRNQKDFSELLAYAAAVANSRK